MGNRMCLTDVFIFMEAMMSEMAISSVSTIMPDGVLRWMIRVTGAMRELFIKKVQDPLNGSAL